MKDEKELKEFKNEFIRFVIIGIFILCFEIIETIDYFKQRFIFINYSITLLMMAIVVILYVFNGIRLARKYEKIRKENEMIQ